MIERFKIRRDKIGRDEKEKNQNEMLMMKGRIEEIIADLRESSKKLAMIPC